MYGIRKTIVVMATAATCATGVAAATPATAAPHPDSASASVPAIGVYPLTQNAAAGETVTWGVSGGGAKAPAKITIDYGNGTGSHAPGTFTASRVFHPCSARLVTYRQRWTITGADGQNDSTETTVKVSYSGPICT